MKLVSTRTRKVEGGTQKIEDFEGDGEAKTYKEAGVDPAEAKAYWDANPDEYQEYLANKKAKDQKITSIAFPLLGSHNGGLNKEVVLELMYSYLGQCNIDIEIYQYQPDGRDDLYDTFASNWSLLSLEEIKARTGIRKDKIEKIDDIISSGVVKSMIGLINEKGIGMKTLEKCFRFVTEKNENQQTLF